MENKCVTEFPERGPFDKSSMILFTDDERPWEAARTALPKGWEMYVIVDVFNGIVTGHCSYPTNAGSLAPDAVLVSYNLPRPIPKTWGYASDKG
jgi:hypothetical protein